MARRAVWLARVCAVLLALAVGAEAFCDIPGAPLEAVLALHVAALYILASAAFLALPLSRRSDLGFALIVLCAGLEVARAALGHPLRIFTLSGDLVGVLAVMAPGQLEALRHAVREPSSSKGRADRRSPRQALPLAVLLTLGVAYATLCPQDMRPQLGDPQLERFGAYFVVAAAFGCAYPRRPVVVALAMLGLAVGLEAAQALAPGRDPGVTDAVAKALGGVVGVCAAQLVASLAFRPARRRGPTVSIELNGSRLNAWAPERTETQRT